MVIKPPFKSSSVRPASGRERPYHGCQIKPLRRLIIAPIPQPLWNINLRSVLTRSQWRRLRQSILAEGGASCRCCGGNVGAPRAAQLHEVWDYNTTTKPAVSKLIGLSIVCWCCHMAEHFGMLEILRANGAIGKRAFDSVIAHYCCVNQVGEATFWLDREIAIVEWQELCNLEWTVDWGTYAGLFVEKVNNGHMAA